MVNGAGCNCPECRLGFWFGAYVFDIDDDCDPRSFFFEQVGENETDVWDHRYGDLEEFACEKQDKLAAEILGVDLDAEPESIKK